MEETSADNGVRIAVRTIPFFKSVSFGIWINAGSRDEPSDKSGLFHFLEHLLFKGTARRSARNIATEIDALGGHIDAFTSREVTCYHGHVLRGRLERAFELVADMTLDPAFPPEEVERERQVILEEIRMGEDDPSDYIHDQLYPAMWPEHQLGRLITGDAKSVKSITIDDLTQTRENFYRPPNIFITACGAVDSKSFTKLVNRYFDRLEPSDNIRNLTRPTSSHAIRVMTRPMEQEHLLFGVSCVPVADERRHELMVLNTILGGGVSSRLFQRVREEMGLAYSIYSFYDQFVETGLFGIYAAMSPDCAQSAWEEILKQANMIAEQKPSADDLDRAKVMIADNLEMSLESISYQSSQMASQMIYHNRIFSHEQTLDALMSVSAEGVRDLAEELFSGKDHAALALGPMAENQLDWLTRIIHEVS